MTRHTRALLALFLCAIAAAVYWAYSDEPDEPEAWNFSLDDSGVGTYSTQTPDANVSYKSTAFYSLGVRTYPAHFPGDKENGSGIALLDDEILISRHDGSLYLGRISEDSSGISLQRLAHRIPVNKSVAEQAFGDIIGAQYFRVADIMAEASGELLTLYATHHYWKSAQNCYVLRLSELQLPRSRLTATQASDEWRTVYESSPCLSIKENGVPLFKGHEAGGRIARFDDTRLIFTLGHHGYDGVNRAAMFPQETGNDYGKVWLLDTTTGEKELFTLGHRNPQGLAIDAEGRVWSTEHGPEGGDELNLLEQNNNYGWPLVTFGTQYYRYRWPPSKTQARHTGFEMPAYAWVPSIGISNLAVVRRDKFRLWSTNLMVGSLRNGGMFRVTLDNDTVVSIERIEIGKGIRDIHEMADGKILLQTAYELITIDEADANDNPFVFFARRCGNCHAFNEPSNGIGPTLQGVLGRDIAGVGNYDYSDSFKGLSGSWTASKLDEFLAAPQEFAPGTKMAAPPIQSEVRRRKLVKWLEQNAR